MGTTGLAVMATAPIAPASRAAHRVDRVVPGGSSGRTAARVSEGVDAGRLRGRAPDSHLDGYRWDRIDSTDIRTRNCAWSGERAKRQEFYIGNGSGRAAPLSPGGTALNVDGHGGHQPENGDAPERQVHEATSAFTQVPAPAVVDPKSPSISEIDRDPDARREHAAKPIDGGVDAAHSFLDDVAGHVATDHRNHEKEEGSELVHQVREQSRSSLRLGASRRGYRRPVREARKTKPAFPSVDELTVEATAAAGVGRVGDPTCRAVPDLPIMTA